MYSQTSKLPWESLREAVTADDTAITVFKWDNWPTSNTVNLKNATLKDVNSVLIAAYGSDAADEALTSYKLYGRTRMNGPLFLLLTGVMTLGAQACTVHPVTGAALTNHLWVDTITITGGLFAGIAEILDTGADRICMIKMDALFIAELYLEIDNNTMASFYAMITGY